MKYSNGIVVVLAMAACTVVEHPRDSVAQRVEDEAEEPHDPLSCEADPCGECSMDIGGQHFNLSAAGAAASASAPTEMGYTCLSPGSSALSVSFAATTETGTAAWEPTVETLLGYAGREFTATLESLDGSVSIDLGLADDFEGDTFSWDLSDDAALPSGPYRIAIGTDDDEGCAMPLPAFVPAPGDSDCDGDVDSSDLVEVFVAGRYETGEPATFAEGDWNGDGVFDSSDLVAVMEDGNYGGEPYAEAPGCSDECLATPDAMGGGSCGSEEDSCAAPPAAPECEDGCIPLQVVGQAAAGEYYNECRNYCFADDQCFNRATALAGAIDQACGAVDLRGPDGKWCDEMGDPKSTAGCDDLIYKVIIRYPAGDQWRYHIATATMTCEAGLVIIDPIGKPGSDPTTNHQTPEEWCAGWAHGQTVDWKDTDDAPPPNTAYCEIVPADQNYFDDDSVSDPLDTNNLGLVCNNLADHVDKLCKAGRTPFPAGCGEDKDGDGIPDRWDKCPCSPPGAAVDYCDPDRLGCEILPEDACNGLTPPYPAGACDEN